MIVDLTRKNEYEEELLFTDHAIFWGEIKKHAKINPDGSGTFDYAAGMNEHLPRVARELGYIQAHVEAFIGMKMCGISYNECREYLNLSWEQIGQLIGLESIIKFRIFRASRDETVSTTAAKYFLDGYEQAYREIDGRLGAAMDINAIREQGIDVIMEEIQRIMTDDLYSEYCELYRMDF